MTNGVVSVVLVGLSLALRPSLTSATGTYAAGSLVALLAWDLPRVRGLADTRCFAGGVARTLRAVRSLTRRAMPLGLSAAIGSVQVNVPRYVIAAYLGPAALAVFTALSHIPTLGNLIVNAIAQAALPVLARDVRQSQAQYRRRLRALVIFGSALGLASVLCTAWIGRPLLAWIYRADYAAHSGVLLWLMAASAVSYAFVFLGTATLARMRFGAQCLISSAGLVVVAGSVVPLVSRYGLAGGACALLAGAIVEGCAYTILTVYDLAGDDRSRGVLSGALAEGVRS
jgi:O-antigen/teichoic acid export membrane protein